MQYSCQVFLRDNFLGVGQAKCFDYSIPNVTFWKNFFGFSFCPGVRIFPFILNSGSFTISVRFGLTILASDFVAKFVSCFFPYKSFLQGKFYQESHLLLQKYHSLPMWILLLSWDTLISLWIDIVFVLVSFNFRTPATCLRYSSSSCCILWNATSSMKKASSLVYTFIVTRFFLSI